MTTNPSDGEAFSGPPPGEKGPQSEDDLRAAIVADIDRTLLQLELGAAHRLRALGERLELRFNELLVLAELVVRPRGLNAAALADIVGVSAGGITGIVDRLAHRGLAERDRDPADGRRVIVVATPAARALWTDRADRADRTDGTGTAFLLGELDLWQVRGVARFVGLATDRSYRQTRQLRAQTAREARVQAARAAWAAWTARTAQEARERAARAAQTAQRRTAQEQAAQKQAAQPGRAAGR